MSRRRPFPLGTPVFNLAGSITLTVVGVIVGQYAFAAVLAVVALGASYLLGWVVAYGMDSRLIEAQDEVIDSLAAEIDRHRGGAL